MSENGHSNGNGNGHARNSGSKTAHSTLLSSADKKTSKSAVVDAKKNSEQEARGLTPQKNFLVKIFGENQRDAISDLPDEGLQSLKNAVVELYLSLPIPRANKPERARHIDAFLSGKSFDELAEEFMNSSGAIRAGVLKATESITTRVEQQQLDELFETALDEGYELSKTEQNIEVSDKAAGVSAAEVNSPTDERSSDSGPGVVNEQPSEQESQTANIDTLVKALDAIAQTLRLNYKPQIKALNTIFDTTVRDVPRGEEFEEIRNDLRILVDIVQ